MTTGIRFFALKSKKEKGTVLYWIEVRTVFNVKTTTTTTTRWSRPASACSSPYILRLNMVLTYYQGYGIPPGFRGGVHLFIYNRHKPSGQS